MSKFYEVRENQKVDVFIEAKSLRNVVAHIKARVFKSEKPKTDLKGKDRAILWGKDKTIEITEVSSSDVINNKSYSLLYGNEMVVEKVTINESI